MSLHFITAVVIIILYIFILGLLRENDDKKVVYVF